LNDLILIGSNKMGYFKIYKNREFSGRGKKENCGDLLKGLVNFQSNWKSVFASVRERFRMGVSSFWEDEI